jgi:hypothetical protein
MTLIPFLFPFHDPIENASAVSIAVPYRESDRSVVRKPGSCINDASVALLLVRQGRLGTQ